MEQISLIEYQGIKDKIKTKLNETVNNFVVIGFYLKQVRDNELFRQDGYKNMEEFAKGEYNLSASTASRFMDINTKFSMDGNSLLIKEEYVNFSYSKLQEMLTVKEKDLGLITEDTTVKQIREIKSFEKAEDKRLAEEEANNLPLVQMAAEEDDEVEELEEIATSQLTPIQTVLMDYWKRNIELLKLVYIGLIDAKDLAEQMSPNGSTLEFVGVYCMMMYDYRSGVKLRFYEGAAPKIEEYTYEDIVDITNAIMQDGEYEKIIACEPKQKEKKVPEVVTNSAPELDNTPIKGQMTTEDIEELAPEPTVTEETKEEPVAAVQQEEPKEIPEMIEPEIIEPAAVEVVEQGEPTYREAIKFFEEEIAIFETLHTEVAERKCMFFRIAIKALGDMVATPGV